MLLPREKKMIELIYRSKNGLTTFELANALNISQRTVKYELQKIKEELKSGLTARRAGESGFHAARKARNFWTICC